MMKIFGEPDPYPHDTIIMDIGVGVNWEGAGHPKVLPDDIGCYDDECVSVIEHARGIIESGWVRNEYNHVDSHCTWSALDASLKDKPLFVKWAVIGAIAQSQGWWTPTQYPLQPGHIQWLTCRKNGQSNLQGMLDFLDEGIEYIDSVNVTPNIPRAVPTDIRKEKKKRKIRKEEETSENR